MSADPTETEYVERIAQRLRKDHPDPAIREPAHDL